MDDSKFNRITLLPITDDLLIVRKHLQTEIPRLTEKLNDSKDLDDWRAFAEAVGCRLTIFNRRRGNEVYQMLISKFESRDQRKESEIEEIKNSLSPLEKRLMDR